MAKFVVETTATVSRTYILEAPDEKTAEAASCDAVPVSETDVFEETVSITKEPSNAL